MCPQQAMMPGHKRLNTPPAVSTPRGRRAVITRRVVELFHRHHGFAGARTLWRDLRHEGIEVTVYGVRKNHGRPEIVHNIPHRQETHDHSRSRCVHAERLGTPQLFSCCSYHSIMRGYHLSAHPTGLDVHGHGYGHQDDHRMAECPQDDYHADY